MGTENNNSRTSIYCYIARFLPCEKAQVKKVKSTEAGFTTLNIINYWQVKHRTWSDGKHKHQAYQI